MAKKTHPKLNAAQFADALKAKVSDTVRERTLIVSANDSLATIGGRSKAYLTVTFINLPIARAAERRGGGAESENNRALFIVDGFNADGEPVEKVAVEHLVNHIHHNQPAGGAITIARSLRKKTADPENVVAYLAEYISQLAAQYAPNFTHETPITI